MFEVSMSNVIDSPKKPPGAARLRAVASELAQVLQVIADELVADRGDSGRASET